MYKLTPEMLSLSFAELAILLLALTNMRGNGFKYSLSENEGSQRLLYYTMTLLEAKSPLGSMSAVQELFCYKNIHGCPKSAAQLVSYKLLAWWPR